MHHWQRTYKNDAALFPSWGTIWSQRQSTGSLQTTNRKIVTLLKMVSNCRSELVRYSSIHICLPKNDPGRWYKIQQQTASYHGQLSHFNKASKQPRHERSFGRRSFSRMDTLQSCSLPIKIAKNVVLATKTRFYVISVPTL